MYTIRTYKNYVLVLYAHTPTASLVVFLIHAKVSKSTNFGNYPLELNPIGPCPSFVNE